MKKVTIKFTYHFKCLLWHNDFDPFIMDDLQKCLVLPSRDRFGAHWLWDDALLGA